MMKGKVPEMSNGLTSINYSRRGLIKRAGQGAAALAIAGAVTSGGLVPAFTKAAGAESLDSGTSSHYVTTAALNLRSQPSTSSSIILVIPKGGAVAAVGPEQNGFRKVSYSGNIGWAYQAYLVPSNGGSNDSPVYTGMGVTTTAVNMRSGPGTNYSILRVLSGQTSIELYDQYANNFRLVRAFGEFGWVYVDYIQAGGGQQPGYLTTTAALNLRSQPSLDASILKVIPFGAKVQAGDQTVNGFRAVTYSGVSGWASSTYLK